MSGTGWIHVATLDQCPQGASLETLAKDDIVALFNVDGQVFALDGICPHQGGPLGKGNLEGSVVTCPWHGWQFDVRTGQHQASARLCHGRWDVRVDDRQIFVRRNKASE